MRLSAGKQRLLWVVIAVGFEFLFAEEHRQQVRNEFSQAVLQDLEKKLEKKQRQVKEMDHLRQLENRFHNMPGSENVFFPEMSFESQSRVYRAIFIAVETDLVQKLVFYDVVEKNGDGYDLRQQNRLLGSLQRDPQSALEKAKDQILEHCY